MSEEGQGSAVGAESRRAALTMVDAVLRRGQRFDVLPAHGLSHADEGLARAIAGEVFRHLFDLDALIDSATAQPLPGDAKARAVLRIALVQALVLGTPPHAAITTVLPLVMGGPKRLVHGVFGTLIRRGALLPEAPTLPEAVRGRWGAAWGYAMLGDAARAIATPPPLDVMLRDPADDGGLGGEELWPGQRRLPRGTPVTELPGYAEGTFWVQNLSAAIPARLFGPGEGRAVLDLCAAPGGKTMQLAAAGWKVTAVEQHAKRAERLSENLVRTKLSAEIVIADVMSWEPAAPFDAIMLDAPCTATGIFARHPDVLHRIGPKDIAALAGLQARMLARAAGWLTPDGRLIYATCSVEPEEGEQVVAASGLTVDPVAADELPEGIAPAAEGWVRILPAPGRDGFFMARLKRP
ncbi:MAG: transcription antitermination factor NusB [Sphingomonadales bacterium]